MQSASPTATSPAPLDLGSSVTDCLTTQTLTSPRIAIQNVVSTPNSEKPSLTPHISAPAAISQFPSPMRHHRRTPSQHREVKETLNARTEYTCDEAEGTQHRINQYVIKDEIGRGSYGAVHLAVDQYGNEFAIKQFSKTRLRKRAQSNILRRPHGSLRGLRAPGQGRWAAHKRQLSRQEEEEAKDALYLIREEIAIMKKLNHPNLVSLIEVLDDPEEDSLYMVLEMCKKGVVMKIGLDEAADPYDEELCRCWFRDLILGIEYLHAQGVVHRDIKPDNLLLTADDVLKIVDFGVSEMFEKPHEMVAKKSMGSPAFLAPELCTSKHGDVSGKAADIWSMGVSLYCLRYGRLPFQNDTVVDMLKAIRSEAVYIPPDENEHFKHLMGRILEKDPDSRITMPELREHPWVTKGGIDPLLPEDENCAEEIEPPNELEVNHAFTRKMTHLFCVMKAIHKFRSLTSRSRAGTPVAKAPRIPPTPPELSTKGPYPGHSGASTRTSNSTLDSSQATTATFSSASTTATSTTSSMTRRKSVTEEAIELVAQRKAFIAARSIPLPGGERGHAQDPTERAPPLLGIGTGGRDFFTTGLPYSTMEDEQQQPTGLPDTNDPDAYIVADSPTGIDFDVYDRAFEAEVQRIRAREQHQQEQLQKSGKGGRARARARTYLTRLVGEQERHKYAADECMVVEAVEAERSVMSAAPARLEGDTTGLGGEKAGDAEGDSHGDGNSDKGTSGRFAELVSQMAKAKVSSEPAGSGSGSG
ncbi:hypothetical protein DL766_008624 [Monosporascus sp. MC13-8B]|uniref:Protein kinase domain-containing protein n=1 Tax=Monosporascus cannonballus TaxID=155416 RepID=A0ABY0H0Q8_9PEZI|nr:hypothetical protein DL762_008426 [Monosporascus cannonballus]RYO82091.1 hypothetical protein DL763_008362 [Monosporascus cannonballus]RYP18691.1 hypothetical protein DL766_008624 [Monosporascus sp. MC13-8B]